MTNQNVGVYDFIPNIVEGKEVDEGKNCNFRIVCRCNTGKSRCTSVARAICVQMQNVKPVKEVTYVMSIELSELGLEWISLKYNRTRKLGVRKRCFTVIRQ